MKTKHYLILSASVVLGIILGIVISTSIMRSQHQKMFRQTVEMSGNDFQFRGQGPYQSGYFGQGGRGFRMANRNNKGIRNMKMNNWQNYMPGLNRLIYQLDLSEDQHEKIEVILENKQEEREQILALRDSRWEATNKEIRDILTNDQNDQLEEMIENSGRNKKNPAINWVLNALDLTEEQEEKVNAIWDRNKKMRENMWKAREVKMDETMDEIKSVLTQEQIEQLDEINDRPGRQGRKGMGRGFRNRI
ncbi:MAG: hypothetical protein K8R74_05125 [Bacteroidales bacterium]|nr:hypothetical protein [Bacteroidales bacterium]